jgi:hypothetical protein
MPVFRFLRSEWCTTVEVGFYAVLLPSFLTQATDMCKLGEECILERFLVLSLSSELRMLSNASVGFIADRGTIEPIKCQ